MSDLEQAAWDALELCERIIDGKRIWSLRDMREVSAPLRAALEQAEPVVEPVSADEAMRLAELWADYLPAYNYKQVAADTAAELRRLHEENKELRHATAVANHTILAIRQQAEPKVTWGVDWGQNGDENCVAIIKKLPNGDIEVVAIERNPAKPQADPTEGNPSY